jgi:hypothetical protein
MGVRNLRGSPRLVAAGSSVLLAAPGFMLTATVSAGPASASGGRRSFTAAFTIADLLVRPTRADRDPMNRRT